MLSVNELIQNAYTRIGLVGDGQSVNGTKAKTALLELNDLIRTLNLQEYISDNIKYADVTANGKITVANSVYADVFANSVPSKIKSVARKVGDRFIPLCTANMEVIGLRGNHGNATVFTYNVDYDKDLIDHTVIRDNVLLLNSKNELPDYDARQADVPSPYAYICADGNFDLKNKSGYVWYWAAVTGDEHGTIYGWISNVHGNETGFKVNIICDAVLGGMKGVITLDSNRNDTYRVMYVDEIQEYSLDDKIMLQPIYNGLLLAGLSYKLAIRYKIQDWVGTFKDEFDQQKSLIKRVNSTNRNIVWEIDDGSYLDNYYNGLNGHGW